MSAISTSSLPVITVHFRDHAHVLACLRETLRHNRDVLLIGDLSNAWRARELPSLRWIDSAALPLSPKAGPLRAHFVNYSTNPYVRAELLPAHVLRARAARRPRHRRLLSYTGFSPIAAPLSSGVRSRSRATFSPSGVTQWTLPNQSGRSTSSSTAGSSRASRPTTTSRSACRAHRRLPTYSG